MTIMTLSAPLDSPLSGAGSSVTSDVPFKYEVAINGRSYRVDHSVDGNGQRGIGFARRSLSVQRAQADTSNTPGEQSLNREADWRRVSESWHHGAGQAFYDRADSDNARFRTSKGVNVWEKWQLSLLNSTSSCRASANTNLRLTTAGTVTYLTDGNSLLFTADVTAGPVVWTTVTGTPGAAAQWLTSDGFNVYVAYGASGIYSTTRSGATASSFNTLTCTVLGYVKGRLMAANNNVLYNVTAAGAPPAALLTHPNTDFAWVGFAEGPAHIFAAGYSGARSLIYKTSIQPDGTSLSTPTVAGELPTGETVRSIKGYLGMLIIGSDLGFRLAAIDTNGNLTIGSLVATGSPVLNFEPSDRFVWYGLTNFDSTSTGLGRIDLTSFTSTLTPAYASDLMATAQGSVLSVSTQGTRRLFTVSGVGVFVEGSTKVASGTVSSGRITYGIGDEKVVMFVDLRHNALAGTIDLALSVDGAAANSIGGNTAAGTSRPSYPLNAAQARGEQFEITATLTRSATDTTTGPTLTRMVLRGYPAPRRTFQFTVPILLWETQTDLNETEFTMNPLTERESLETAMKNETLVSYQEGSASYTVLVDDLLWLPRQQTGSQSTYDGTLVCVLKEMTA